MAACVCFPHPCWRELLVRRGQVQAGDEADDDDADVEVMMIMTLVILMMVVVMMMMLRHDHINVAVPSHQACGIAVRDEREVAAVSSSVGERIQSHAHTLLPSMTASTQCAAWSRHQG